jgi:predicted GIY-YIG superfamily endonuclease
LYVLKSTPKPTKVYIGITSRSVERRLQQHNGYLVGGARPTKQDRPWELVFTVHGFSSKRDAVVFEEGLQKSQWVGLHNFWSRSVRQRKGLNFAAGALASLANKTKRLQVPADKLQWTRKVLDIMLDMKPWKDMDLTVSHACMSLFSQETLTRNFEEFMEDASLDVKVEDSSPTVEVEDSSLDVAEEDASPNIVEVEDASSDVVEVEDASPDVVEVECASPDVVGVECASPDVVEIVEDASSDIVEIVE